MKYYIVKEEKNILHTIKRTKTNWIGHILRKKSLLKHGLECPGIEIPVGARCSAPVQTGPGAHAASCTMGTGSLSRGQSGRGVALTTQPHLAPRLKKE
jgi:hypothetical protein